MADTEQKDQALSETLVTFPVKVPILSILSTEYFEV